MCRTILFLSSILLLMVFHESSAERNASISQKQEIPTPSTTTIQEKYPPFIASQSFFHYNPINRDNIDSEPRIVVFPTSIVTDSSSEHAINIANEGDETLSWTTETEARWISCDPEEGELRPYEDSELFVTLDGEDLQRGVHDANLYIHSNDQQDSCVTVTITFLKEFSLPPRWIEIPHHIEAYVTELVTFMVRGTDPENDQLALTCSSNDLPDGVRFIDHGNGIGTFHWQTTYSDSGAYQVSFQLTDGLNWVNADMVINIHHVLRSFALFSPEDGSWITERSHIQFSWFSAATEEFEYFVSYTLRTCRANQPILFTDITDTCINIEWDNLNADPRIASTVNWEVWAHYVEDSLRCVRPFHFTLAPLSAEQENQVSLDFPGITYTYPNPFNEATSIGIKLEQSRSISLIIYDMCGRKIENTSLGIVQPGWCVYRWKPVNLVSGTYFAVFNNGSGNEILKLVLFE